MSLQSLMQQQQQPMPQEPEPQAPVREAPQEQQAPDAGGKNATPADQDAYDRVVVSGMKLLNNDQIRAKMFALLQQGKGSPAKILGNAALQLMGILREKAPKGIPESVVGSAGIEIMMMLAEEADKAGVFTVDERTLKGAAQILIRGLATMYNIPPQELDAAIQGKPAAQPQQPPAGAEEMPPEQAPQQPMPQGGMLNRGRM